MSVVFFDIQSDLSDISKMTDTTLQFFVTVDSNSDDCTVIQNFLFVMNLIIFLEFLKLALNKLQSILSHEHNFHARFSDNVIIRRL